VEFDTLVDGIPPHLKFSVWKWVNDSLSAKTLVDKRSEFEIVADFDLDSRRPNPVAHVFSALGLRAMAEELGPDGGLDLVDFLIFRNTLLGQKRNEGLEKILARGGSLWCVGVRDGHAGLERRVPEGVHDAANEVMAIRGNAGTLMSKAWHAAFGRNPNYEEAYKNAVLAVEAAATHIVEPTNAELGTLGTTVKKLRNDANWSLNIRKEHKSETTAQVVLALMQSLWTGQERHAGVTHYPNTKEEAEAAVFLAVPLVQWFSSGAIKRR